MSIRQVPLKYKKDFNRLASHPLQSWEWGQFRKKTGVGVIRLGRFEKEKLKETAQITIHPLPIANYTVGYFPKGGVPTRKMVEKLIEIGKKHNSIFIKLEPNVEAKDSQLSTFNFQLVKAPHPLFPKHTFILDLRKSEKTLFKNMHQKTRYNIRLAKRKGVAVHYDNSKKSFNQYLKLLFETTKRQKFFAHDKQYHKKMWQELLPSGISHILNACFQKEGKTFTLASWMIFMFGKTIYYPYGGSSEEFKNLMASNLLMWEAIKFGKKHGAEYFDMWGAAGPEVSDDDPWYGFHKFKKGYGPKLVKFLGSYDLVIKLRMYQIYNYSYKLRQLFLRLKSSL